MMTRVAVAQLAGRTLDEAPTALEACRALVAAAAADGAEVVVLPEGAIAARQAMSDS
jgi:predicted amidohydrolase